MTDTTKPNGDRDRPCDREAAKNPRGPAMGPPEGTASSGADGHVKSGKGVKCHPHGALAAQRLRSATLVNGLTTWPRRRRPCQAGYPRTTFSRQRPPNVTDG